MKENLVKRLMTSTKCNVCGRHYQAEDIGILGHEDELWFLTAACAACDAEYLVAAVIMEDRQPKALADLSDVEIVWLEDGDAVTVDDLADMRDFLRDFDGDFARLFGRGKA
ncbi:MAG: hypothetical protein KKF26_03865 [Chloroflexi bacterium]|nr:hypothetical protein [Chloroflexota bacterium]